MSSCKTLIQFLFYTLIETKSLSLFKQINTQIHWKKKEEKSKLDANSLFLTLSNQPPPINQTSKSKSTLWLQYLTHKYPEEKDKNFEKMKQNPSKGISILQHYLQQLFACFFLLAFLLLHHHHHLSFKNWALVIVIVIMRNRQTERIGHRTVNTETNCIFYPRA